MTAPVRPWALSIAGATMLPALLAALPLLLAACAAPVGAVRADPNVVHRELTGVL